MTAPSDVWHTVFAYFAHAGLAAGVVIVSPEFFTYARRVRHPRVEFLGTSSILDASGVR